jgi:hypothetical protein
MAHRLPNPTLGRHNANDVAVFRRSRHGCPGLARQLGYKVTRIFRYDWDDCRDQRPTCDTDVAIARAPLANHPGRHESRGAFWPRFAVLPATRVYLSCWVSSRRMWRWPSAVPEPVPRRLRPPLSPSAGIGDPGAKTLGTRHGPLKAHYGGVAACHRTGGWGFAAQAGCRWGLHSTDHADHRATDWSIGLPVLYTRCFASAQLLQHDRRTRWPAPVEFVETQEVSKRNNPV